MKKVGFGCYKYFFGFKIDLQLMLIPGCDNNSRAISVWPFKEAKINGVTLIIWVKFHKMMLFGIKSKNKILISLKKIGFQICLQLTSTPFLQISCFTVSMSPISDAFMSFESITKISEVYKIFIQICTNQVCILIMNLGCSFYLDE